MKTTTALTRAAWIAARVRVLVFSDRTLNSALDVVRKNYSMKRGGFLRGLNAWFNAMLEACAV
jgi:hypothetical protein